MEIFQDGELEEELRKRDFQGGSLAALWALFTNSYEEAVRSLTHPLRATYTLQDLGPQQFALDDGDQTHDQDQDQDQDQDHHQCAGDDDSDPTMATRQDLQLQNDRGQTLECSFWRAPPTKDAAPMPIAVATTRTATRVSSSSPPPPPPPCVVYLHGLSSSRRECVYLRHRVLRAGFSLFALDLSGSGRSGGDHVTFGALEKHDLRVVLDYLFATHAASAVALWGRGLGGATALLHLQDALTFSYKTLHVTPSRARTQLQIGRCRHTGHLLGVRPPRVFPFRVTSSCAENGDFVILSVGNRLVKGMRVEDCQRLLDEWPQEQGTVRVAGYELRHGVSVAVPEPFVFALALDSTYGDLERVIADMLTEVGKSAEKRHITFSSAMLAAAGKLLGHSVARTAGYHFRDVAVLDDAPRFHLPCLFVSASRMDFIQPQHTRAVYERYGGPKTWLPFEGVHDQNRPPHVVDAVCQHFQTQWKR